MQRWLGYVRLCIIGLVVLALMIAVAWLAMQGIDAG
jgi:hypothetical protein